MVSTSRLLPAIHLLAGACTLAAASLTPALSQDMRALYPGLGSEILSEGTSRFLNISEEQRRRLMACKEAEEEKIKDVEKALSSIRFRSKEARDQYVAEQMSGSITCYTNILNSGQVDKLVARQAIK